MKNLLLHLIFTLLVLALSSTIQGQNVAINNDASSPNTKAMLDIKSSDKGLLIPRMSTTQRTGIVGLGATEDGLMVYDTTLKAFMFYNGISWSNLSDNGTSGWGLSGNAGTTNGSHFIGTTDGQDLDIRVNDTIRARITQKGQIEILNTTQSVFIGEGAGENNTAGTYNTFVGYQSGNRNTTGNANTAFGSKALFMDTTGSGNAAFGFHALYLNTIGSNNAAFGFSALRSNTTAKFNAAFGSGALSSNTTGGSNAAFGTFALLSNTEGSSNAAFGSGALSSNTTGVLNAAFGTNALTNNTTGAFNAAFGTSALYSNTTGVLNTAFGTNALSSNTAGGTNAAFGSSALSSNKTGIHNTAVGARAFSSDTAFSNSTAIGYDAEPGASNTIRLGNSSVKSIGGQVSWTAISDGRFKKNVCETVVGLDFIRKLRPVCYQFDMDAIAVHRKTPDDRRIPESEKLKEAKIQTGFIAQEVEAAAIAAGYDFHGVDKPKNNTSYYGLRYAEFVVPLVKAVQEQDEIISSQMSEISSQTAKINKLKAKLDGLTTELAEIKTLVRAMTGEVVDKD